MNDPTESRQITIRNAARSDLPKILEILNFYIDTHHCIFDIEPWSVEAKDPWFEQFHTVGPYQLRVACRGDEILAYAHSSPWRPKKAYDVTAETTIYVDHRHAGHKLGQRLLADLINRLEPAGLKKLVAGIALPNEASERLHLKAGFREVGTFHGVGLKFGKQWDVRWFEYDF